MGIFNMKKKKEERIGGEDSGRMTLVGFLCTAPAMGNIEIVNECSETLLMLKSVGLSVCPVYRFLSEDLLNRKVLGFFNGVDGALVIKVEGIEDAE